MAGASETVPGRPTRYALAPLVPRGEIERYCVPGRYEPARRKNYGNLEAFSGYIEPYHVLPGTEEWPLVGAIVRALDGRGVPMEGSKGEWGRGQQELNAEYSDLLEQA